MLESASAGTLAPWTADFVVPEWVRAPVVVGCSGGADSSALLALAAASGLEPVAVHVDHGIRPGSHLESSHVEEFASRLGAGFDAAELRIEAGGGFEARAREARYAALEAARRRHAASAVLVGHTADDQAETVLLNLLRGAATTGLSGMPEVRGTLVRPILRLCRRDTAEICRRLGLAPLDDPMNADVSFRRVWLRREIIPRLEAGSGADLRARLARQAGVLRGEAELLDQLADAELARLGSEPGCSTLDLAVGALPMPLARRAVRRWLSGPDGAPPDLDEVDRVLAVASGRAAAADVTGARIERAGGLLHRLRREPEATPSFELSIPGRRTAQGLVLETWVERATPVRWPDGRWTCVLDADAVGDRVEIRAPRAAERFVPLGMTGSRAITDVLADCGVPASARPRTPLMAAAGTPVWLLGYRVGAFARVTASTTRYLWARATSSNGGEGERCP